MLKRTLTAAVGIPIVVAAVWVGNYPFTLLVAAAAAIAALEMTRMARAWGQSTPAVMTVAITAAIAASGQFVAGLDLNAIPIVLAAVAAPVAAAALLFGRRLRGGPGSTLAAVSIAAFVGGTLFLATVIRNQPEGRYWILLLLLVTFATDTGAYAVGRTMGSRRLAPSISPGKTWEGAVGGFVGAVASGAAFGWAAGFNPSIGWIMATAAVLGVTGQAGDLFESKLKRIAGLDDSGTIFPGHGGMLDRLDSITFNLLALVYVQVPLFLVFFDP